jgi:predicted nuclease with TOPRIM domain
MITLEQIRLLETKVQQAVDRIGRLMNENAALRRALESNEARVQELERIVSQFKDDQGKIEQGIINALAQLDSIEDTVGRLQNDESAVEEERAAADPVREEPFVAPASLSQEEFIADDDIIEDEEEALLGSIAETAEETDSPETAADEQPAREAELDIF